MIVSVAVLRGPRTAPALGVSRVSVTVSLSSTRVSLTIGIITVCVVALAGKVTIRSCGA